VTVEIAEETFTTSGLHVLELNYLKVYVYEKWADRTIPKFVRGDKIMPKSLLMHQVISQLI